MSRVAAGPSCLGCGCSSAPLRALTHAVLDPVMVPSSRAADRSLLRGGELPPPHPHALRLASGLCQSRICRLGPPYLYLSSDPCIIIKWGPPSFMIYPCASRLPRNALVSREREHVLFPKTSGDTSFFCPAAGMVRPLAIPSSVPGATAPSEGRLRLYPRGRLRSEDLRSRIASGTRDLDDLLYKPPGERHQGRLGLRQSRPALPPRRPPVRGPVRYWGLSERRHQSATCANGVERKGARHPSMSSKTAFGVPIPTKYGPVAVPCTRTEAAANQAGSRKPATLYG